MIVAKPLILETERIKKGLTKTDLSKQIGVHHSVIVRAEQSGGISPKTAKAICDFFGMDFNQLFIITKNNKKLSLAGGKQKPIRGGDVYDYKKHVR